MKQFFTLGFGLLTALGNLFSQASLHATLPVSQAPELLAFAGEDIMSSGTQTSIGGAPSAVGGTPPYQYSWAPIQNLSNPTVANPAITPTQEIEYTLTLTDSKGCTASDNIRIKISSSESLQSFGIRLFPNPATEQVQITLDQVSTKITKVQLLDISGKVLQDHNWNMGDMQMNIFLSEVSAGKYLIRIDVDGRRNYLPLLIER